MDIQKLYRTRFKKDMQKRKYQIWHILCNKFFSKYIDSNSTCLEIASGYGEFINNIVCKNKIAVDINPDSKKYLNDHILFLKKNVIDLNIKDTHGKVDVIFMSNFLEHLKDKTSLELLFKNLKNILKDNGKILILGPNLKYLPGSYWDYYDHHLGLTELSLKEALVNMDYKIELSIGKFLPYTVNSKLPNHPCLVNLYLKFPVLWRFFGKQFFIVCKK